MPSSTSMAWPLLSQGELILIQITLYISLQACSNSYTCTYPQFVCKCTEANVYNVGLYLVHRATKSLSDDVSSSSHEKQLAVVWCDQASVRVELLLKSVTSTSSLKTDASMSAIAKDVISNRATVPVHPLRV